MECRSRQMWSHRGGGGGAMGWDVDVNEQRTSSFSQYQSFRVVLVNVQSRMDLTSTTNGIARNTMYT